MNEVFITLAVGLCPLVFTLLLWTVSNVYTVLWAWVDDKKYTWRTINPVTHWFATKIFGLHYKENKTWLYYDSDGDGLTDGSLIWGNLVIISGGLGFFIIMAIHMTALAVSLGIGLFLLYSARAGRRLKKKFDAHCTDTEAHKEGGSE